MQIPQPACILYLNFLFRLQQRQETEWNEKVTVLFGDMRHLEVPEKADILVSELLGSFGDNELSPECLDGAMRFLKGMFLISGCRSGKKDNISR